MTKNVAVIGDSVGTAQCALTLAHMGAEVSIITSAEALSLHGSENDGFLTTSSSERLRIWPLLLRVATHPRVKLYTSSHLEAVTKKRGEFTIKGKRFPRYVDEKLCTSCGLCREACPVKIPFSHGGRTFHHSAIHAPLVSIGSVPAAYFIDKNGTAPCQVACPLGINVSGFICLLAKGKVDEALCLINEAAPLAGVLGRVCTHPCENNCQRAKADTPVFIQALHRYAADSAYSSMDYNLDMAKPRKEKIAIVGSGPSGLTAAWELARRGYSPTIFESHAVVGGMLATGIPRFRLPREVREKEVEAVRAMGVDIKTGVIVGRDITLSDLREQGYQAFYLAIGAGLNNKLNIPGEDLEGVVDVISMLFALNLKVGTTIGSNVVVIGGGNSAVDSARAVKRRSKGTVRILYRRTAEEMTAIKEHVEEAIEEGVLIEYLTAPVEIIGDGTKVTGIRCQRMKLGEVDATGRRQPVPIEGSEFTIDADHVVVAIGQRPSTTLLRIRDLKTNDDATIKVDPLTLQTNIPDIFAGGDCITGPNTVVEAMAAGLRVAESIDRYVQKINLREGRSLERLQPAEVDIEARYVSPQKRAKMPILPHADRMGSFEETNMGLPAEAVKLEAERCLSCALCSGCLECERVCQVKAVSHKDTVEPATIEAKAIVNFVAGASGSANLFQSAIGQDEPRQLSDPDIFVVEPGDGVDLWDELDRASAMALRVAQELKLREKGAPASTNTKDGHDNLSSPEWEVSESVSIGEGRTGVVLCRCGGSISSIIEFVEVTNEIKCLPGVFSVHELSQVCTEYGGQQIKAMVIEDKLDRLVIAACRCCNLEQVCFSCTEQRIRCQQHLNRHLTLDCNTEVEFVNIREQCVWVHGDNPVEATQKAVDIINSGVFRAQANLPVIRRERSINESALVISTGLSGLATAVGLASQDYPVTLIHRSEKKTKGRRSVRHLEKEASLLKELEGRDVFARAWPQVIRLDGVSGNYEAVLEYSSEAVNIKAGVVIVDSGVVTDLLAKTNAVFRASLFGRILDWISRSGERAISSSALRGLTIGDTVGIFLISTGAKEPLEKQVIKGQAVAARVSCFFSLGMLKPRTTAVSINRRLCRGCGDCTTACPYIEMKVNDSGIAYASVDPVLCLGCGACLASCPTGAITQAVYSDSSIISTLEALLKKASEVGVTA